MRYCPKLAILKAKEEVMKDKEVINKIIAKINQEDMLVAMKKEKERNLTKNMINQYHEDTQRLKDLALQKQREEDEKIKEYAVMIHSRQRHEETKKRAAEEETKKRWSLVAAETQIQQQKRDENDALRNLLWEEEREERMRKEELEKILRHQKQKVETMRQNKEQIQQNKNQGNFRKFNY